MLEQGRPGVVINIWSVNARHPMEANSAYCAAKAGVDMITRCGALELGPRGIRVVGIAPGLVETPLMRNEMENSAIRALFTATTRRTARLNPKKSRPPPCFSLRNMGDRSAARRSRSTAVC